MQICPLCRRGVLDIEQRAHDRLLVWEILYSRGSSEIRDTVCAKNGEEAAEGHVIQHHVDYDYADEVRLWIQKAGADSGIEEYLVEVRREPTYYVTKVG